MYTRVGLGVVYTLMGMLYTRLGMLYTRVGMLYFKMWMVYTRVGEVYTRVGVVYRLVLCNRRESCLRFRDGSLSILKYRKFLQNGSICHKMYRYTIRKFSEVLQGNQLYMAVCFWYLVKSDLSSVCVYTCSLHCQFLQGTRKTWPCLSGQVVSKEVEKIPVSQEKRNAKKSYNVYARVIPVITV